MDAGRGARRRQLDGLLLVPALLLVLADDVLWSGARHLLRWLGAPAVLQRARIALGRLPVWLALPLFLIPEGASHVGTLASAVLLVRGHWLAAVLCYAASKLIATVLAVWIYQGCEATLLTVGWFARVHAWASAVRDWGVPRLRRWLRLGRSDRTPVRIRFRALRRRLAWRLAGRR